MGPNLEARASMRHPFTSPTKAKVQAVIEFNTAKGLIRSKQEVFDYFKIGRTQGYPMLNDDTNRRRHNTGLPDPRGRPSKLSETNIDRMDEILQTCVYMEPATDSSGGAGSWVAHNPESHE